MSDKQECSGKADMTPGIVSWNELVSRDPDASKKFYSQLFGWKIETMNMGPGQEYTMMKAGDRPAAGLIRIPAEAGPAPTMWMSYVTVPDLPAAVAKAKALGAKICTRSRLESPRPPARIAYDAGSSFPGRGLLGEEDVWRPLFPDSRQHPTPRRARRR